MWAMNNIDLPDADSPRPNLANIPSMDDMLALYEKVLAELDSAISTAKDFSSDDKTSSARHGKDFSN
jgi:hypothetical protein